MKRIVHPGIKVQIGDAPIGWWWGQSGGRPEPGKIALAEKGYVRHRTRSAWLQDPAHKSGEPMRVWLRCIGCGRWKKPSRYSVRPDILPRLKCRECGGRFRTFLQIRADPPSHISRRAQRRHYGRAKHGDWVR